MSWLIRLVDVFPIDSTFWATSQCHLYYKPTPKMLGHLYPLISDIMYTKLPSSVWAHLKLAQSWWAKSKLPMLSIALELLHESLRWSLWQLVTCSVKSMMRPSGSHLFSRIPTIFGLGCVPNHILVVSSLLAWTCHSHHWNFTIFTKFM